MADTLRAKEPTGLRWALRGLAVGYVFLLVAWPTSLIAKNTFADGLDGLAVALADPAVQNGLRLTLVVALSAVAMTMPGVAKMIWTPAPSSHRPNHPYCPL